MGTYVILPLGPRPSVNLILYQKEACIYSRKVREALSILDIDVNIKPCPKEGTKFRHELLTEGGKMQIPFLVDPNTNTKLYESSDIVKYLFKTYGPGEDKIPALLRDGFLSKNTSLLATMLRCLPWHGMYQYKGDTLTSLRTLLPKSTDPKSHNLKVLQHNVPKTVHLYNYEGSGNCRFVREALDSLEIPYTVHNIAKGSPKRSAFIALSGKMQVPYLIDENTEVKMFESQDIVDYLYKNYNPSITLLEKF